MSQLEKLVKSQVERIVFVCSGNIIRSAFAHLLADHYIKSTIEFVSLGTTYSNERIHDKTAMKLSSKGIDKSIINQFIPTHIRDTKFVDDYQTVFLCMTNQHMNDLREYYQISQIHLISTLLDENKEVSDPYFTSNYDLAFDYIERCVMKLKSILS